MKLPAHAEMFQRREDFLTINDLPCWVIQGFDPDFHPADLKAPTWFISVNHNASEDREEPSVLNEAYGPGVQDAQLARFTGVSVEEARAALWNMAQQDLDDHMSCWNGGLYAVWDLGDGSVVVAGMDNGGSDIAATGAMDTMEQVATPVGDIFRDAHFQPEMLLDQVLFFQNFDESERLAANVVMQVLDAPTPDFHPVAGVAKKPSP